MGEVSTVDFNREFIFASEYIVNGLDAGAAAKRAGYQAKNMKGFNQVGNQLLKKRSVKQHIANLKVRLEKRYEISFEKIGRELAQIAFFDPAEMFDDKGNMRPLSEIPPHVRRVITGLDVEQRFDKDGKVVGNVKKLRIASKEKALEMLAKIQGMFQDSLVVSGQINHTHEVKEIDLEERIRQMQKEKAIETTSVEVDLDDALL